MFGSGLHFNSPGVVRVQKTFSAATVPGFDWTLVSSNWRAQNIITSLPLKGPSLIPFACVLNCVNIDPGAATSFYILYYVDSTFCSVPLLNVGMANTTSIAVLPCLNGNNVVNKDWITGGTVNAGIIIGSDSDWFSGDSLTVTLYCVQSGLNY